MQQVLTLCVKMFHIFFEKTKNDIHLPRSIRGGLSTIFIVKKEHIRHVSFAYTTKEGGMLHARRKMFCF
jgi:hypothetical protein